MSDNELSRIEPNTGELTIPQLASNMDKLRDVMRSVMKPDTDFGQIPGTKSKPTLLKPGGEKLAMLFRYAPSFEEVVTNGPGEHREYQVKCRLIHIPTGNFVGEASAVCSTMESKYRYRGGARKCPMCGKEAIKKSKFPPRDQPQAQPGFYCYAKIGGCGANFTADDPDIINQSEAKTENPDIADQYNTVKQIAQKRAFLSAIKTATASSELFTIDVGDPENEGHGDDSPPDDRRPHEPRREADASDRRNRGRQAVSGEGDQTRENIKPELSVAFVGLRDMLYAMGVPQGNRLHADAVCNYGFEGSTIAKCAADSSLATKTHDGILNRSQVQDGVLPIEQVYADAIKAAGIELPKVEAPAEEVPY